MGEINSPGRHFRQARRDRRAFIWWRNARLIWLRCFELARLRRDRPISCSRLSPGFPHDEDFVPIDDIADDSSFCQSVKAISAGVLAGPNAQYLFIFP